MIGGSSKSAKLTSAKEKSKLRRQRQRWHRRQRLRALDGRVLDGRGNIGLKCSPPSLFKENQEDEFN